MKIPMNKKYRRGLVMDPASASLQPVDRNHYVQQWIYGAVEPAILKVTDFMYNDPVRTKLYNKLATPKALPREVVCSTDAVCRFIDFIYSAEADNDCPRMAVTKCVCQTATDTYAEPVWKDMALLYTANLYTTVKHTAIGEPYHIIETAEEAKKMIRQFDADRLVHTIMYCHGNGRWTFVVCNCDDTICVPMKAYLLGRRTRCWPARKSWRWTPPGAKAVPPAASASTAACSARTRSAPTASPPWTLAPAWAAASA